MAGAGNCRGIIPLGNTGVGKSYLMNMLIGQEIFKSGAQADSVTAESKYYEVCPPSGSDRWRMYDVSGLVELDQTKIDRNIKEIRKAFNETPISLVMFVWTGAVGGRPLATDVLAFKYLYVAYEFPYSSIIHVINKPPKVVDRNEYLERFVELVSQGVAALVQGCSNVKISLAMKDFMIIDEMNEGDEEEKKEMRKKLFKFINDHCMLKQEEKKPLQLSVSDVGSGIGRVESANKGGSTPGFWKGLWKGVMEAANKVVDGVINVFQGLASLIGYVVVITGAGIELVSVATVSPVLLIGNMIAGGIEGVFSSK
ncbi:unnamed protein product [Didymodactylos carnosus]|uniref:AIG1-type G domain-containing protein n=1 Tax=Didymodactylos carnosus TaxID=1234261 RepID=A0A815VYD9_9BILA|nr:unnamed protein product [Didymodactylos carnosus]CAF1538899.1 unnamed protein product [Didymodactylos carnosus]CAF3826097.1 unnamed protein product [Didymodactylos carnosus]CAF4399025.1 unnamed protein product [Didymodactylos carnosus]